MARRPTSRELKADLAKGRLEQIYLFIGDEEGEKDKCITTIAKKLFDNEEDRYNATGRFYMESGELMGAVDFALATSMFHDKRLCIMRNCESLKAQGGTKETLRQLIEDLPSSTCLIMTVTGNKMPSVLSSEILSSAGIYQFWRFFDEDLMKYIYASMQKSGFTISSAAASLLLEKTGKDIRKIDEAMDLIRYSGTGASISEDVIRELLVDSKEITVYDFTDELFLRRQRALRYLKKLLDDGVSELLILSRIAWQSDTLMKYHQVRKRGEDRAAALKTCGIYDRKKDRFLAQAEVFTPEMIARLYPLIMKVDAQCKSGNPGGSLTSNPIFELASSIINMENNAI